MSNTLKNSQNSQNIPKHMIHKIPYLLINTLYDNKLIYAHIDNKQIK